MFLQDMEVLLDSLTGFPEIEGLEESYDRWNRRVKASVAKPGLLKFHVQDSWGPLCEFLSPMSAKGKANCDQVLDRGEPFPHVKDMTFIQSIVAFMKILCLVEVVAIAATLVTVAVAAGSKALALMHRRSFRSETALVPKVS
jgi:hypothetical protein